MIAVQRKVAATFLIAVIASVLALRCQADSAVLSAFPGAQGFASHATGGRGGSVYLVTNLDDSGPGSFRDAVSQPNRTVIFDVGGYVDLKSPMHVASDITIAGQTAPSEGIGTRNCEISFSDSKNVIVRYIRFRQGNTAGEEKKSAVNITGGSDMIFDHVSIEWGRWDTVDMNKCTDMTFQYCIIGQGVSPQRFGCLCQSQNVTFTHNLWIDNQSRNPKAKGTVQYVNNVIYNWGGAGGFIAGHSAADSYDDLVGNYFIAGPSSTTAHAVSEGTPTDKIFSSGNYADLNANGVLDGIPLTDQQLGNVTVMKQSFSSLSLPIDAADQAYRKVVAEAGCSLHRDRVDQDLIGQVQSLGKKGKIIQDVSEIGGSGQILGGDTPPPKRTGGIPDDWLATHPQPPNSDRSTDLERYLNALATTPGQ